MAQARTTGPAAPLDHHGIAEQGKVHVLLGRHELALLHFREAMRLAVAAKAPEVVFRHYLECSLETLEHLGAHEDVLAYCDRALAHYEEHPPRHELARLDRATIRQRRAAVLLKLQRPGEAREDLEAARDEARRAGGRLALAEALLRWVAGGLHVQPERVLAEQRRHGYFSIREDTVDRSRAVPLPPAVLAATAADAVRGARSTTGSRS